MKVKPLVGDGGTFVTGGPENAVAADFDHGYWAELGLIYVDGFQNDAVYYGYTATLARSICSLNCYIGPSISEFTIESVDNSSVSAGQEDLYDTVKLPWTNGFMPGNIARLVVAYSSTSFGIYDGALALDADGHIVFQWQSYSEASFMDRYSPVPWFDPEAGVSFAKYTGPSGSAWLSDPFFPAFNARVDASAGPTASPGQSPYSPPTP